MWVKFRAIRRTADQEPDCAYCAKKPICVAGGNLFFEGVKRPPCHLYVDLAEKEEVARKKKERQEAFKNVFTPTPRPDGEKKDCLYCRKLHRYKCRNRMGNIWPNQGGGETCANYADINIRPTEVAPHCDYCLIQHYCDPWTKEHRDPCGEYKEYVPEK